ncbi:hypothetical protein NGP02_13385 [Lactiplantibacillus pentosus]|uniref:hypothetical protein n=1 Tax=Lactiplantibacillus pentosus TaxID=1589 RepID=UPI002090EEA7|nr:hypothetical protein [Lactiplantibacillus pentosus]WMB62805.1 hypothetical protein NGP02_13385 [Lactiplantibacillus pentosus]
MPRQWKPLKRHPGIYEYETKRGKKYGIRRSYTDINHKYRTWSKSGFMTWRDADIELKKFEVTLGTGQITASISDTITLQAYFDKVLKRNIDLKLWRPATITQKKTTGTIN